jgi:hypothetical protein
MKQNAREPIDLSKRLESFGQNTMFSAQDLVAELSVLCVAETPPLKVVEFCQQDFEPSCSEQMIWAFQGSKLDFASGILFWVKTLQAQDWNREPFFVSYVESALCQSIPEAEFTRLIREYSGSLKPPLPGFLKNLVEFRSGLRMYAEWNDVAAMAELEDSFVAFYWATSA